MRATMKLAEPLSHALCFDVSVQNGPGRGNTVARAAANAFIAGETERDKREQYAERIVAAIAGSGFAGDVKSRKVDTLVDGSGKVHGDLFHLVDWGLASNDATESDPPVVTGPSNNADFNMFFAAKFPGLTAFSAADFLVKGGHNAANHLNTDPPKALWPNIVELVGVLVKLKSRLGNPSITFNSVYRSPAYNASVGGANASQHMQFKAADIVVHNGDGPQDWASEVLRMRGEGIFKGGVGIYGSFVHVDTRGHNADWRG